MTTTLDHIQNKNKTEDWGLIRRFIDSVDTLSFCFIVSKKTVRGCVLTFLLEYKTTTLFFEIIKPRRKEYLPSQYVILFEPVFRKGLIMSLYSLSCHILSESYPDKN